MVFTRSRNMMTSTWASSISASILASMLLCMHGSQANLSYRLPIHETLPGEVYLKFYLFNVTNPEVFEVGEGRPMLQEIGPYVFRETTETFNITHSSDGTTTTFSERKYYEYFPELSADSEGLINFINVPLMSFGMNLARVPMIGVNLFKSLLKAKETIIKRDIPIKDFFYGYDAEPFMKIMDILLAGEPVPPQFEGGTFGLLKDRNGTVEGPFQVGTGTTAEYEYGQLVSWKGLKQLDWWAGGGSGNEDADAPNYCNMINGTAEGSTNRDIVDLQHYHIYVFVPDTCRSLKYTYSEEVAFSRDDDDEDDDVEIVGLKYKFNEHMLENLELNPDNKCFCISPGEDNKNCLRTGAMDLGPCRKNAPMAVTYPHFLDADPYYLDMVENGLEPRDVHESFMIVEPKTGIILQDIKRMQLNIRLKPTPVFNYLKNLPDMLFPVLWTEKVYTLDKSSLRDLAGQLNDLASTANLIESWRVRSEVEKLEKLTRKQDGKDEGGGASANANDRPVSADEQARVHDHHGGNTSAAAAQSSKYFSFNLITTIVTFLYVLFTVKTNIQYN